MKVSSEEISDETVIVWFRRDLRLHDNPALSAACSNGNHKVLPVYIWAPEEEGQFQLGRCNRWWLKHSLEKFKDSLRKKLGLNLLFLRCPASLPALAALAKASSASKIYFNYLFDPVSLVRDNTVKAGLTQLGLNVEAFNGEVLFRPWEVLGPNKTHFDRFKPYWKCCRSNFTPEPAISIPLEARPSDPLPSSWYLTQQDQNAASNSEQPGQVAWLVQEVGSIDELGLEVGFEKEINAALLHTWQPGEEAALRRLDEFCSGDLHRFTRDTVRKVVSSEVSAGKTSRLSGYLHFGELSVKLVWQRVTATASLNKEAREAFTRQLGFREYSRYVSFHYPLTHERAILEHLRSCPWQMDQSLFKSWRLGRTGYPLVDAGMRELLATGWMHNKMRVVTASFLVKFLMLPWPWGVKYFWDSQIDADLEEDVLGWQYISGCLPDGIAFDVIDDPEVEGLKLDPEGHYVRRWIPELSRVPKEYIHKPSKAPAELLVSAQVELGETYPWPIASMELARERNKRAMESMHAEELERARRNHDEVDESDASTSRECSGKENKCLTQGSQDNERSRREGSPLEQEACIVPGHSDSDINTNRSRHSGDARVPAAPNEYHDRGQNSKRDLEEYRIWTESAGSQGTAGHSSGSTMDVVNREDFKVPTGTRVGKEVKAELSSTNAPVRKKLRS